MRNRNSNWALPLALPLALLLISGGLLLVGPLASSLEAQSSTLDGFKKSRNSIRQKSPQRQLAQKLDPAEKKANKNTQLPGKSGKPVDPKTAGKTPDKKPALPPVTKERRAELMKFVQAHHPELRPLLHQLESKREKQFQSVLRSLDRNIKKHQALKKKSPERYQRAVDLWGVTSRIQLLSAQMAIKKSDKEKASIRKNIRPLLEQQFKLRRAQAEIATKDAKKKYDKLAQQLKTLETNRDADIARKMKEIDKTSQRVNAQNKKSAEKKQPEKTEKVKAETPKAKDSPKKIPPAAKAKPVEKPVAKPVAKPAAKPKPAVTPKKEDTKVQK